MVVHFASAPAQTPACPGETACVARASRARRDLAPGDPLLRAAELLLAAPGARFNIDLLARRTAFSRQFVAACTRRLYDNGVWRDGRAHYAADGPEDARFWDDAAVALGTLCRRSGPAGHEWAPPGTWSKPYDYVGAACPEELAIAYQDASAPPDETWRVPAPESEPAPEPECEGPRDAVAEAAARMPAAAAVVPGPAVVMPVRVLPALPQALTAGWLGGAGATRQPGVVWLGPDIRASGVEGRRELFPGAAWLG